MSTDYVAAARTRAGSRTWGEIVSVVLGAALVLAYLVVRKAVGTVATFIGAVYLIVGLAGPFVTGTDANILALNSLDHALHLGSAAALLAAGINARRAVRAGN